MYKVCIIRMVGKGEYKFKKNLLLLSYSKDLKESINEWVKVGEHKTKSRCNKCICQHTLKYMTIIYNNKTGKYAGVGDTCYKHITDQNNQSGQSDQTGQSGKNDQNGEYEDIDDINKYSDDIKKILEMDYKVMFENTFNECDTCSKLNDLLIKIKECPLNKLGDICSSVNNKLMAIEEVNQREKILIEEKKRELYEQQKKKFYNILVTLIFNRWKGILRNILYNWKHCWADFIYNNVLHSLGPYNTQKEADNAEQDFRSKKGVGYTKKKERKSDGKISKFSVYKNKTDKYSEDSSFDGNNY